MFREQQGDLWSFVKPGVVIVITTNSVVTLDGRCVMGKGVAKQARDRFPGFDKRLGEYIKRFGERCYKFPMDGWTLATFPTKHHWRDKADLSLIAESAEELMDMADKFEWDEIYMPRPGCGAGGLQWVQVVMSGALDCLDERFVIVNQ